MCHAAEVPADDGACVVAFEALAQQWDKENISKWQTRAPVLSSEDLDMEVRV